jgi:hypothetical protein
MHRLRALQFRTCVSDEQRLDKKPAGNAPAGWFDAIVLLTFIFR